jgi:hypothetical protein
MDLIQKITNKKKNVLLFIAGAVLVNALVIHLYYESLKSAMDNNYVFVKNYPLKLERITKK